MPDTSSTDAVENDAVETDASGLDVPKLMRLHAMADGLLEELHRAALDPPSRRRLAHVTYETLVEVGSAVPSELLDELSRLARPGDERAEPSVDELRVVWAEILGWISGIALSDQLEAVRRALAEQQDATNAAAAGSL